MIYQSLSQFVAFLSLNDNSTYINLWKRQNYIDGKLISVCWGLGMGMMCLDGCDYKGLDWSSVMMEPFYIMIVVAVVT